MRIDDITGADGNLGHEQLSMLGYEFINCIATYMFNIFNHRVQPSFRDDILLFLTSVKIRKFALDTEQIQKKHGNLGRYYQAFNFSYSEQYHESQKWHFLVSDYLSKYFSMKLKITFGDTVESNLVSFVENVLRERGHLFLLIDDYYSPDSKKHYLKHHDTHWINILKLDHEAIIAQDSNYSKMVRLPFRLLEQAYFSTFSRQETAFMDTCCSTDCLDYSVLFQEYDPDVSYIEEFPELIDSIRKERLPLFYLDGLNNSIMTKCIPMFYMYQHLASKECRNHEMIKLLKNKKRDVINHFTKLTLMEPLHNPNTGLLRFACNDGIG